MRCRSPGGQRRPGPVEGEVAESHIEQRGERPVQLGEQSAGQSAELGGQPGRPTGRELGQLAQREGADLGQVAVAQLRGQRFGSQPGAVADRADPGDNETLDQAAGALVVAAQRAFYRGDGVVVVDVELHGPSVPARMQGYPLLNRLAVQHDVALVLGQATRTARPGGRRARPRRTSTAAVHRNSTAAPRPRRWSWSDRAPGCPRRLRTALPGRGKPGRRHKS